MENPAAVIRNRFGDGRELGVSLRYVSCPNPDLGLARGVLLVRHEMPEPFVTILGDELYLDSNHRQLLQDLEQQAAGRLARARQLVDKGQTTEAIDTVTELVRVFAGTRAAVGPMLEDRTPIQFAKLVAERIGGFRAPPGFESP